MELGLGGGGGRSCNMEESEIEEGEACSFRNHEEEGYDYARIDPDVDLSYIDERIQDVLGHFQKDFEGGVSAENLGAKFGGYGSFLPTHQRSPGLGHPRTPSKAHSQNTPRSPSKLQMEGDRGDAVQFSTGTQSLRPVSGSNGSSRLPSLKAPSVDDGITQENCMATADLEAFPSKYDSLNMKPTSILDQKTLKFRIKMGADNLPSRNNAAIYSGLGLDMSPSSSLDDSPSESEGISREHQDAPSESPNSILQIVTTLPMLLSPLADDLIQLTEKETRARQSIPVPVPMDKPESSGMLLHESKRVKSNRKSSGGKKMKSLGCYESSVDIKGCTKKNTQNDVGVLSKKEQGIGALNSEELVSKTLNLPLLSSSFSFDDDLVKAVDGTDHTKKDVNKGMVREKTFSGHAQKSWAETKSTENGFAERKKGGSGASAQKRLVEPASTEVNGRTKGGLGRKLDDVSVYAAKDNPDRDIICDSIMGEPNVFTEVTASDTERIEPPKKTKGSHGIKATEREKQKLSGGADLVCKTNKSSDDSSTSKNETEKERVQKDLGKAKDTYRDFFGELGEEDTMDSPETPHTDKLKEAEAIKTSKASINHGAKEKLGGKNIKEAFASEVYPKKARDAQYNRNLDVADPDDGKGGPVSLPPVVMEDNWVQCDWCHKWRLLPVGTNPDNLPEKWLCSMLNWLPDMNRCSVSEDETTKALITLYQVPLPHSQSNLQNVSASVIGVGTAANGQHTEGYQLNHDPHAVPDGNNKFGKETSSSANKDGSSQFLSSMKKNLLSSGKSRSLNDVNKSPVETNTDIQVKKQKNKQRMLEHNPDRGDTKKMKVKRMEDPNQDCSRLYKKSKVDGMHCTDEEWIPQGGTTRKGAYSSKSAIPPTSVGKDLHRPKDRSSSRDSKYKGNDKLQVSVDMTQVKGQGSLDEGSLSLGNHDLIGVKKRKLKEYHDAHLQESYVEDFNDSRKEKKSRNSKSEGRDSGSSKGSGRTDKKGSHTKNQKLRQDPGSTLSQQGLDGMAMELAGPVQASVAATTSSSSKVSGSHKTKASFQEVKGSPVESVSSSPMRILTTDMFTNREATRKDGFGDATAVDSPQRCSDAEAKGQIFPSPDIAAGHVKGGVHTIHDNVSHPRKISKESLSKDNSEKFRKTSSAFHMQNQSSPSEVKRHKECKVKLQEKSGLKLGKSENIHVSKKDYTGNESRKKENKLNREHDCHEVHINGINKQEALPAPSQHQLTECDSERSSKSSLAGRTGPGVVGKDKLSLPPSKADQAETLSSCPLPPGGLHKGNGDVAVNPPKVDDSSKLQKKQIRKNDLENGNRQIGSRHSTLNGHRSKELDNPSPVRRDSNSHPASNALKEAKDLKHLADRLKNAGSTLEGTGIYFQAALKFLHGASILESSNNDHTKHNDIMQSMQIYSSTAKLCEFCAHEYEKSKNMAAASLAYKCMELAYMRVIYTSNTSATRDRHELQTVLQMVPLGESPSSSASDVDNVNNSTTVDKIALSKCTSSPHVVTARNRPNIVRLLNYTQDVTFAMEASRKSRNAFAAAKSSPDEGKNTESMSSIKKALDFSFQNVDGLLRLVRLAMEAITR